MVRDGQTARLRVKLKDSGTRTPHVAYTVVTPNKQTKTGGSSQMQMRNNEMHKLKMEVINERVERTLTIITSTDS